ncbi:GntR family transcriptional regulator [Jiangella muralis]|uniref:GntR family transcriptional regulator n=1 Tax=Jiangella muralis TaxID=702383 RepID=UPI00069EC9B7|nr:GntR family transcriptional regulator [Jiangella muralis]
MSQLLAADTVDPHRARPQYRQIADAIVAAIDDGRLAPGDPLPSKRELHQQTGVTITTVTSALDFLAARGHIVTARGVVARVAPRIVRYDVAAARWHQLDAAARLRRGDDDRGERMPDDGIDWDQHELTVVRYSVEAAPHIVASRLGMPTGAPALRREFIEEAPGLSRRLRVGWIDHALAEGTDVADPAAQPWRGGTIDELHDLGVPATSVTEYVRARLATEDERALLDLPVAGAVMNLTRIFHHGDRGVETSDVVTDAATMTYVTTTDIT